MLRPMCHVEFGVAFFGDVAATQWGCFWLPQRWSPYQSRLLRRGGFFGGGVRNFFPKVWAGCASLWAAWSTGVLGHGMANFVDHGTPQHKQRLAINRNPADDLRVSPKQRTPWTYIECPHRRPSIGLRGWTTPQRPLLQESTCTLYPNNEHPNDVKYLKNHRQMIF